MTGVSSLFSTQLESVSAILGWNREDHGKLFLKVYSIWQLPRYDSYVSVTTFIRSSIKSMEFVVFIVIRYELKFWPAILTLSLGSTK
jgi:hypothetical protein